MDRMTLARRLVDARAIAGLTQDALARAVNLDRTAISRLEKGERKLSAAELVSIAHALNRPLSLFVTDPVPSVVSRRTDRSQTHEEARALDLQLDQFAGDVQTLLQMSLLPSIERFPMSTPRDHGAAESMARDVRRRLNLDDGPIVDIGRMCDLLGLYTIGVKLGQGAADGACVEVGIDNKAVGAAVINSEAPPGRRRMTLAHELGHWLSGDAYDSKASVGGEKMINSFAVHFLAPRGGIITLWNQNDDRTIRDRALIVAASYRLSWTAMVGQLRNVGLIDHGQRAALAADEPTNGDYLRMRLGWTEELQGPYVSPGFAGACLDGFVLGVLTEPRVLELLRGTLPADQLPKPAPSVEDDLHKAFADHGR